MSTSAAERAVPPLTAQVRRLAVWVAVSALLAVFVVVVGREIVATFDDGVATVSDDEYVLFATSITGLVGGVFAVAVGAVPRRSPAPSQRESDADRWRARLATAYVLAYAAAGIAATVVSVARLGTATPLLQSLAGGFLGASAAAASAFFGVADVSRR